MAFDSRLIGKWSLGSAEYVVEADGWYFSVDGPSNFVVSSDGLSLTFEGENPVIPFTRIFGSGETLVGVWARTILDNGITYVEEVTYRMDGSYSTYWTADGVFESDQSGKYAVVSGSIRRTERRALISTSVPDIIEFNSPYGPDSSGTYSLSADQGQWTFTSGGQTLIYDRLP